MTAFFVGQRVKKVKGRLGVGMTGVVSHDSRLISDAPWCDMAVRLDGPALTLSGMAEAGEVVATCSLEWEPILGQHTPGSWEAIERLIPGIRERAQA